MQRHGRFFPVFLIFLIISLVLFFFARQGSFSGVIGFFEGITVPLQRVTFGLFNGNSPSEIDKLREENRKLLTELAHQKELEKENKALHDQFQIVTPATTELLPAKVIGMGNETVTIDKGEADGLRIGAIVIYQDNFVGQIVKVSVHKSVVSLLTHKQTSFTGQEVKTESLGVIKGKGQTIFFENVLLSDTLEKDDLIVTKGDVNEKGEGVPPGLVVGKIISVHKNPSALFQTAEVESLVDFSRLSTVFVLKSN